MKTDFTFSERSLRRNASIPNWSTFQTMNEHGSNCLKWDQNVIEFRNVKGEIRMIKIIGLRVTLGIFSSTDLPCHQIVSFDAVTKILSMKCFNNIEFDLESIPLMCFPLFTTN